MSRTKKREGASSPVKKYLSFSGSTGKLKYYNKEHKDADEKGNVSIDRLDLVLVDIKSSISGYNENASSGINSNLLDPYKVGEQEFIVKTKVDGKYGVFAQGIYKDIKADLATINAKFTTNLFAIADFGEGYELVKLEINGSGLSPWIDITKDLKDDEIYDKVITVEKGELLTRKGGKTVKVTKKEYDAVLKKIKADPMYQRPVWFYAPKFTLTDLNDEKVVEVAIEKDEVLQTYFDGIGGGEKEATKEVSEEEVVEDVPVAGGLDDDLPF